VQVNVVMPAVRVMVVPAVRTMAVRMMPVVPMVPVPHGLATIFVTDRICK